jgi:4-hydroxy-2-oxoheptanedioate aldolase
VNNKLREAMSAGKSVFGTFAGTPDPSIIEVLGYAGFDYIILDMEHGPLDTVITENLMRACDVSGAVPVVRVTQNNASLILRALDCGAMGVIIPQINDYESAVQVGRAAKYAPDGFRGMALGTRATKYGIMKRDEYLKFANEEPLVIIQCETQESLDNLEEIVKAPNIDMIFIGPTDLSQSMGFPGLIDQPEVQEAIHKIVEITKNAGLLCGIFVRTVEEGKYWANKGVQFVALGGDKGFLFKAASQAVSDLAEVNS